VTFYADKPVSGPIGTVALGVAGTADLTTSFNAEDSPVSITATYNGDSNYNTSSTSAGYSQNVNKANTTVAITGDTPDPSVVGQAYVVSGTVTPANTTGTHTTTGTVQVSDGTDTCTDTTLVWNASGYWDWSCSLTSMSDGASKTITATYSGDSNYDAPATVIEREPLGDRTERDIHRHSQRGFARRGDTNRDGHFLQRICRRRQ
jgi:hypothetical protein